MKKKTKAEVDVFDARGHKLSPGDCVQVVDLHMRHVTTGTVRRKAAGNAVVLSLTGIERVEVPSYLVKVGGDNASTPTTWFHAGKPDDTTEFERLFSGGAR